MRVIAPEVIPVATVGPHQHAVLAPLARRLVVGLSSRPAREERRPQAADQHEAALLHEVHQTHPRVGQCCGQTGYCQKCTRPPRLWPVLWADRVLSEVHQATQALASAVDRQGIVRSAPGHPGFGRRCGQTGYCQKCTRPPRLWPVLRADRVLSEVHQATQALASAVDRQGIVRSAPGHPGFGQCCGQTGYCQKCTIRPPRRWPALWADRKANKRTEVFQENTPVTLRASLSGTFLQTLPDLVTPLKGHSLSPRICPATRSAPSERFGY